MVLGYASINQRLASGDYRGATIGRYANRIARGHLEVDGTVHQLGTHDRGNSLHGGPDGFDRRLWKALTHAQDELVLRLVSPDADQGYPGEVTVTVRYAVSGNIVRIEHWATTDAPTVVNLTNHTYFQLDGEGNGTVDEHLLTVPAELVTPVDGTGIPLGGHLPVAETPFDLRRPAKLGVVVRQDHPQLRDARGIDHNYVVPGAGLRAHAVLESPRSGVRVEVRSDRPGLQVYSGNFLDGTASSTRGGRYRQGDGIAPEPQLFPDTPHHPDWPSAVLRPDDVYRSMIEWTFSATH